MASSTVFSPHWAPPTKTALARSDCREAAHYRRCRGLSAAQRTAISEIGEPAVFPSEPKISTLDFRPRGSDDSWVSAADPFAFFGVQGGFPPVGILLYCGFMSDLKPNGVQRWLNVAVRSLHLIFVILLGAALLRAPLDSRVPPIGLLVSGAAMLLLDLRIKPHLLREVSGAALMIKFAALSWMVADDHVRQPMFWGILVWSSVFSHAPAKFRHRAWWPPQA
jgi:hypothetical protein